jgi:hypothetical protein
MTVFKIVHEQSLLVDADNHISEVRPWTRIELGYEAIQRGWLKRFNPNWLDLPILLTIGLHARPLLGADFQLLKRLDLVGAQDEGRLYARVTDTGLADMLSCSRQHAGLAAERLAGHGLLRVLPLPKNFRDSRGQFAGTEAFLLPGEILVQSKPDSNHRVTLGDTVVSGRVTLGNTVIPSRVTLGNTVTPRRVTLSDTKILPTSLTLSDESDADASALSDSSKQDLDPDSSTAVGLDPDRGLAGRTDNNGGAYGAAVDGESSAAGNRLIAELKQTLENQKSVEAFVGLLTAAHALNDGLTDAGLRVAAIMLLPLPERRRKVLNDLRKMRGSKAKPGRQRHFIVGILGQHIGAILGLGLDVEGRVRCVPTKDDYAAIGALTDEYGAETLWLTTCLVAGQAIEGDPLNYLRAALRNKRERDHGGSPVGAGMGRFDQLDYAADQTG